jgi:hypothetical protein
VLSQPGREGVGRLRAVVEQRHRCDVLRCDRRGNRRSDAAGADDEARRAVELEILALQAAGEPGAVEHVAEQRAVLAEQNRVARSGDLHGGRAFVEQRDGGHLVRHRHQRAADVAQAKQRPQERRVVLGLDAHRHDDGVDAGLIEIRVVDEWSLECFGRKPEVRNQRGLAAYHFEPSGGVQDGA